MRRKILVISLVVFVVCLTVIGAVWFAKSRVPASSEEQQAGNMSEVDETAAGDLDGDGLTDEYEEKIGTDKALADTDSDGLDDYTEVIIVSTNPLKADSDDNGINDRDEDCDGDGISNAEEIKKGTNPFLADTDFDGINDGEELVLHTDPLCGDSDEDGVGDGAETAHGTNPLSRNELFTDIAYAGTTTEKGNIQVTVSAQVSGEVYASVSAKPLSQSEFAVMSKTIPGYMGSAFEFTASDAIASATVVFEYDSAYGTESEDFRPRIYYYNEETEEFEELPDQIVADGKVTATIEHFSIYSLLNKKEFDSRLDNSPKVEEKEPDLKKFYRGIYYGDIPLTNGSLQLVGYDLASKEDFDGDGLKNSEEIKIVVGKDGRAQVQMISDPTRRDTDGDGIDDAEDSQKKRYNISPHATVNMLLNHENYAAGRFYDELYTDGGYHRAWNEVYSAVGYLDYGTQAQVFKEVWIEYLANYCENFVADTVKQEYAKAWNDNVFNTIDDLTGEINNFLKLKKAGTVVGDAAVEVGLSNLITARDALLASNVGPDALNKAMDVMTEYNKEKKLLLDVRGAIKKPGVDKAMDIIGYATVGVKEVVDIGQTLDQLAAIRANAEVYLSCSEILENMTKMSELDPAARKAASELQKHLDGEYNEFLSAFWISAENLVSGSAKIFVDAAMNALTSHPFVAAAQFVLELVIEMNTEQAYKQNKMIANESMIRSTCELFDDKTNIIWNEYCPKDADEADQIYVLLSHLCQLRLYGELLYADAKGTPEHLQSRVDDAARYADSLGISISGKLLQRCDLVSAPNVILKLRAEGTALLEEPSYTVLVDGVQQCFEKKKREEYALHLEPGVPCQVTVLAPGPLGSIHRQTENVTAKADEEVLVVMDFKLAGVVNYITVSDKDTAELLPGATLILRKGHESNVGDDYIWWEFAPFAEGKTVGWLTLPSGDYMVEIAKEGYETEYFNITVPDNQGTNFAFELEKYDEFKMDGSGTAEDPYQVKTAAHVDAIRNDLTAHYIQMNDIDMSAYENFQPIGKGDPMAGVVRADAPGYDYGAEWFEGTFDGNGYKISNLNIYQTELDCVGLFSGCGDSSRLININIENAAVAVDKEAMDYEAFYEEHKRVFAVNAGILVGRTSGVLENCTVSGELNVKGCSVGYVGGITGFADSVVGCTSYANITAGANKNYNPQLGRWKQLGRIACGGIIGRTRTMSGPIEYCRNYGSVTAAAGYEVAVGGICGELGYIHNCINYGDVAGNCGPGDVSARVEILAGGIVGDGYGGTVLQCANLGNISSVCNLYGENNLKLRQGGIAGQTGVHGGGKIIDCVNGGTEITWEMIGTSDSNEEDRTVYAVDQNAGRIMGGLGGYNYDNHSENYSVEDTLLNGAAPEDKLGHKEFNGGTITRAEFEQKLGQILAEIEK